MARQRFESLRPVTIEAAEPPRPVPATLLAFGSSGAAVVKQFRARHGSAISLASGQIVFGEDQVATQASGKTSILLNPGAADTPIAASWFLAQPPRQSRVRGRAALADELARGYGGSQILGFLKNCVDRHSDLWLIASTGDRLATGALVGFLASPEVAELAGTVRLILLAPGPSDPSRVGIGPTVREIERIITTAQLDPWDSPAREHGDHLRPDAILWFGRPAFDPAEDADLVADALRLLVEAGSRVPLGPARPAEPGFGCLGLTAPGLRTLWWPTEGLRRIASLELARLLLTAGEPLPGLAVDRLAGERGNGRSGEHPLAAIRLEAEALGFTVDPSGPPRPPENLPVDVIPRFLAALNAALNGSGSRRTGPAGTAGGLRRAELLVEQLRRVSRGRGADSALRAILDAVEGALADWREQLVGTRWSADPSLRQRFEHKIAEATAALKRPARHERLVAPERVRAASASALAFAQTVFAPTDDQIGQLPSPLVRIGWIVDAAGSSFYELRLAILPANARGTDGVRTYRSDEGDALEAALVDLAAAHLPAGIMPALAGIVGDDRDAVEWLVQAAAPFSGQTNWLDYRLPGDQRGRIAVTNVLAFPSANGAQARARGLLENRAAATLVPLRGWGDSERAIVLGIETPIPGRAWGELRKSLDRQAEPSEYVFAAERFAARIEAQFYNSFNLHWGLAPRTVELLVRPRLAELFIRATIVGLVESDDNRRILRVSGYPDPVVLPGGADLSSALRTLILELPCDGRFNHPLAPRRIDAFTASLETMVVAAEESPDGRHLREERYQRLSAYWLDRLQTLDGLEPWGTALDDARVLETVLADPNGLEGML
jgi:hypothetical protein